MTFTELMGILNGEYKEIAGTDARNQCVDLANTYIKFVLGLPIIEHTNAVDFPSKAGDKYKWIPNTPTGVPKEGDLVIWKGTWGHIAIFIEGNAMKFKSFDENYPTGTPCHVQEHNYTSPAVLGWLHPLVPHEDTCPFDRDTNWNMNIAIFSALKIELNPAEKQKSVDMAILAIKALQSHPVTSEKYKSSLTEMRVGLLGDGMGKNRWDAPWWDAYLIDPRLVNIKTIILNSGV